MTDVLDHLESCPRCMLALACATRDRLIREAAEAAAARLAPIPRGGVA